MEWSSIQCTLQRGNSWSTDSRRICFKNTLLYFQLNYIGLIWNHFYIWEIKEFYFSNIFYIWEIKEFLVFSLFCCFLPKFLEQSYYMMIVRIITCIIENNMKYKHSCCFCTPVAGFALKEQNRNFHFWTTVNKAIEP